MKCISCHHRTHRTHRTFEEASCCPMLLCFDFYGAQSEGSGLWPRRKVLSTATRCIASAMRASQGYQNFRWDWQSLDRTGNFQETTRPYPTGTWNSWSHPFENKAIYGIYGLSNHERRPVRIAALSTLQIRCGILVVKESDWVTLGISQISSINSSTTKTRNRGEQSCKHCNFPASASLPSWGEGGILRASHPPDQLGNTFKIRETILLNSRRSRRIPDCLDLMAYTAISTFWPASDCSQLPRGRRRLAMA
jgi:hypothetical protein